MRLFTITDDIQANEAPIGSVSCNYPNYALSGGYQLLTTQSPAPIFFSDFPTGDQRGWQVVADRPANFRVFVICISGSSAERIAPPPPTTPPVATTTVVARANRDEG
ncbi:hypothetical protein [Luedemannella helvata]|uniref:hypothetical protein n=1 Tax=Luedemannella helvata TaxID=349315 RepID=UPI0031D38F07